MRAQSGLYLTAVLGLGLGLAVAPLAAQQQVAQAGTQQQAVAQATTPAVATSPTAETPDTAATEAQSRKSLLVPHTAIQHAVPRDQRGLNQFEPPKLDGTEFDGFALSFGAAFTQAFQDLSHSNAAAPSVSDGVNANQLKDIGAGFDNASANLYLDAQVAPGIRVALETYLSSRHHNETWVKDGYLLIDQSPINWLPLQFAMAFTTVKVGHFEIDYGDAHFRRSDNGQSLFNPFVGNLIMDAFTTEVGGEVYVRPGPFIAMVGLTGGEIHGEVTSPSKRSPAIYGKLGFDKQITPDVRVRLTGSVFSQAKAMNNTFFGGDRAGSPYWYVMENTAASSSSQAWSGTLNPGMRSELHDYMINPFVKVGGLELFGVIEGSKGRAANEATTRTWHQYAGDVVYRFLDDDLFVGGRYNTAKGQLAGITSDVSVDRTALSAGWFVTPSLLLKGEYVNQKYNDFPTSDIRAGGQFDGLMLTGVVSF